MYHTLWWDKKWVAACPNFGECTARVKLELTDFSVQGVKSHGGHFACLCRGFDFYEVKKDINFFQKEKVNTFTLMIIFIVKSLQKEQIAQIYCYEPKSARIKVQSPQTELTPRRLTLKSVHFFRILGQG